ncbi:hypothetical protein Bca52824_093932 [Brassica carinata]|uniref:Pentatricopeptide repeat-containing protein n=1 Tax=Brassica carinata TaxID=52824 RepID=A0A8X7P4J7_BRACI|nr:hypothetical protein Bca52824_093932 [Brassica carinata]
MKRMKVLPDKVSYTSMISAYNRAREFETCVELYQEFRMNRGKIDRPWQESWLVCSPKPAGLMS